MSEYIGSGKFIHGMDLRLGQYSDFLISVWLVLDISRDGDKISRTLDLLGAIQVRLN
jgi:hypothetical protein